MTELERYEPNGAVEVRRDPTGGRLVAWASGLQAAHQIGTALCATTFAPKHFQGKPEEAAAAIMFGDEIGLTPTQALRSIYVIGGTPALYSRAMVALVLSQGHQIWTVEDEPSRVSVSGQRRGSSHVETVTWTTDRARKAGYTSNQKYASDSQAMLYARASGDVARRIAPDVLAGVAYSIEELELGAGPTTTVSRAGLPTKMARKPIAAAPEVAEPDLDEPTPQTDTGAPGPPKSPSAPVSPEQPPESPDPPDAPPLDEPPGITPDQLRKLHTSFTALGIEERQERLDYAIATIDRPLASSKDLTRAEASRVIDALEKLDPTTDEGYDEDAST